MIMIMGMIMVGMIMMGMGMDGCERVWGKELASYLFSCGGMEALTCDILLSVG